MLAVFTLTLTGTVPLICNYDGQRLLCNDPHGCAVYAVAPNGSRLLDESGGPVLKSVVYEVKAGESLLVVAR